MREDKIDEAFVILKKRLESGPQNRVRLRQACRKAGVSTGEYREALYRLGVKSYYAPVMGGWACELRPEDD